MRVLWLDDLDDLTPGCADICVLTVALSGNNDQQRQQRRALALRLAAAGFGRADLHITMNAAGAPGFYDQSGAAPLYLSHASREGLSAIAVGTCPVGVDLERIGPAFVPAWAVLTRSERLYLETLADPARHIAFLQIWTAKEAALKLEGTGLSVDPAMIEWRHNHVIHETNSRRINIEALISEISVISLAFF